MFQFLVTTADQLLKADYDPKPNKVLRKFGLLFGILGHRLEVNRDQLRGTPCRKS